MKKLPYSEGSVFLVPLEGGGYARGVVARATKKGPVLLGYFFGPCLRSHVSVRLDDLVPSMAILCIHCGDLGLINGEWPIVGRVPNWDRSQWPTPCFVRRDPLSKKAWKVMYSDDDPNEIIAEYPADYDSELAADSLYGYGAVATELTQLLGQEPTNTVVK